MTRRPLSHPSLLAFALAAATALPAAAALYSISFEIEPAVPTWQDEVTITVRGESSCPGAQALGKVDFVSGVGPVLRVVVEEKSCFVDPPTATFPFEETVEFDGLEPTVYTVQVTNFREDLVLADTQLTVYALADLEIELPAMPPTDAAPFVIAVRGVTNDCVGPEPATVEDGVITLLFPDDCPILPPGGGVQTFHYPVGPLPAGDYEVRVFRQPAASVPQLARAEVHVYDSELCVPESDVLCLNEDRFAVRVQWRDFQGNEGVGQALPFRDDTGMFWFFDPENVELTIKVLAACPVNGYYWVFIASGSTVEYEIRVTDTDDDETAFYRNASGNVPELIPDTGAFACP